MLAPTRLLLDTDIGTDVDDCLALALILKSPEIQLEGVTCVYGDVALRTRMVRKMLQLAGREDIPVCMGCRKPLLGIRPVYWAGHEGRGMLEAGDESLAPSQEHAADFIIRTVMANPGEIHLLAIGPLTNVALACLREPRLVENLAGLTVMAGAIRGRGAFDLPYAEHNVRSDPEAAHIVFASGARVRMVPLDVTMRVAIRRDGVERIRQGGTPLHELVARQVELYPHFAEHGFTYLHDPLAAASIVRPELLAFEALHIDVELAGSHAAGATLARQGADDLINADVALAVDAPAFEAFLVERLSS